MANFYSVDKAYFDYLNDHNINSELVFKKAGIPIKALKNKDISISRDEYINLMNVLDEVVSIENLLDFVNVDNMVSFMPPVFAAMCSKDGETCFNVMSKYKKLVGPFVLNVERTDESLSLEFKFDDSSKKIPRFTVITEQILVLNIIRKAVGERIIPKRITSMYKYDDKRLDEYFGKEVEIDERAIIEFNIEDVKKPFLTENNVMWSYLEPELKKRIQELEVDDSFAGSVRSVLFELIPSGRGIIDEVAAELGVSSRTLQRKLTAEKTTFIKQLNHTRELLARSYLKDSDISNDDIAFLIGYSDANSFVRAFKNWTGMTITQYKKKVDIDRGISFKA